MVIKLLTFFIKVTRIRAKITWCHSTNAFLQFIRLGWYFCWEDKKMYNKDICNHKISFKWNIHCHFSKLLTIIFHWYIFRNNLIFYTFSALIFKGQKQPSRGVLKKSCSGSMQQIYRRTPMPKCDFNKVAKQLYWNHSSAWVFSCKFAVYFQDTFS